MLQLYIDLALSRLARHAIQPIQLYSYTAIHAIQHTALYSLPQFATAVPDSEAATARRRLIFASVAVAGVLAARFHRANW